MAGNMRKGGFWNRPGTVSRHKGRQGGTDGGFMDAVTDEDVVLAVRLRNARARRENEDEKAATREARARAKVTLSSPEWLANFMKD